MPRGTPATRSLYRAHPLFRLRRASLINAAAGLALSIMAISALVSYDEYSIPPFLFALVLHFLSYIYCQHDLVTYVAQSARSPAAQTPTPARDNPILALAPLTEDPETEWPTRRLVISDLLFAIAFQWLFWGLFAVIANNRPRYSYGGGTETFEAYANLTNLVASVLHGIAFWKELMARKYAAWKRDLEARVCRQCAGAVEDDDAERETGVVHPGSEAAEASAEAASAERPGLLERLSKGKIILPTWAGGVQDAEEGREGSVAGASVHDALLATPDESNVGAMDFQGYGTLAQSVESVASAPETVVKKKEKGKKRLVDIN